MSDDVEDDAVRCSVCGQTFDSEAAANEHLLEQGLLR